MAAPFDLAESPVGAYFAQMAELGVMRLLTEYGVLAAIPDAGAGDGTGVAVEALAASLAPRVEYALLERFCRLLVASGTLVAPAPGRVARTPRAAAMADPAAAGFYNYLYDFFLGPAARWPAYFAAQGDESSGSPGGRLAEPATSRRCPAGFALGHPDKTAYEILAALPAQANTLNGAMAVEGDIPITGFYDFGWLAAAAAEEDADPARPLLVDVGGGKGQALAAILRAHPGIPAARCVLQDQAAVVAVAQAEQAAAGAGHALRGVRTAGASFFEASPAPGARAYYVRRVLNDWADAEAAAILARLRAACAPDSRVLVAEYLRPEPADAPAAAAAALVPAAVDMFIMSIGGKVRSEAMFRALAARAGFDVARVAREPRTGSAVLELVPV